MSIKAINIISGICAVLSIVLVGLACFAPIIFTNVAFSDRFVFDETGQIGDTIGGTMSPVVAIAGVFMTFIAFLMQVNANRIQSEQLKKSFSVKRLEEKIDSRKALQLLDLDIKVMIREIGLIAEEIEAFGNKTEARPTGDVIFHFTPKQSRNRYLSIDRNLLFNAFVSFIGGEDSLEEFRITYSLMDFYSGGFDMIHDNIYKPYTDDIMECKNKIPDAFEKLHNAVNDYAVNADEITKKYVNTYNNVVTERLIRNGILDVYELFKHLEDERFAILYSGLGEKYNDVKRLVNRLITQNRQMVKALYDSMNESLKMERYNKLKQIERKIDSALTANTIESIQDQFEHFN